MKLAAALTFAILANQAAHAGEWPEHGFYRVDQPSPDGVCRFRTEFRFKDKLVALILVPHSGDRLMAQVLSTLPGIVDAPTLRISAGNAEVADVTPVERIPSPELPSFVAIIPNGTEALAKLTRASHVGASMRLTALPFDQTLPSEGLTAALDDLTTCMTGGSAT